MKRNNPSNYPSFEWLARILILILMLTVLGGCTKNIYQNSINTYNAAPPYDPRADRWTDWNVLFTSGSTISERNTVLTFITNYINNTVMVYNAAHSTTFSVHITPFNCPCDPLLWNISSIPLLGTGSSPNPPPPPGKGQTGSGDAVVCINPNNSFIIDSTTEFLVNTDSSKKIQLNGLQIDTTKLLAVMDTGLDSSYFVNRFNGLLWRNPQGYTLRNYLSYLNGRDLEYYFDDEKHKHGTAVTTIALQALESIQMETKPRVMVLKVLDDKKRGSTFSVSCGLSYAIQHHATLINASLGYYSDGSTEDTVLKNYINLCNVAEPHSIPIIAAAGNIPGLHTESLCQTPTTSNELSPAANRLFFPACFKTKFPNVISVTGLQNSETACYYQNYSNRYISVGVVTNSTSTSNCCKFPLSYLPSGYEGSSFATPVVAGKIMGCLMSTAGLVPQNCLNNISTTQSIKQVTVEGRYLDYTSPPIP